MRNFFKKVSSCCKNYSKTCSCSISRRYIICIFTFLFFVYENCCSKAMKTAAHFLIDVEVNDLNANDSTGRCGIKTNMSYKSASYDDYFNISYQWNIAVLEDIECFFWIGYTIASIIGGLTADTYGSKKLLCVSLFTSAAIICITPPVIHHTNGNLTVLKIVRVITGLSLGVQIPCTFSLYSQWVPEFEQTKLCTLAQSGMILGEQFDMILTPVLVTSCQQWGAPFYFYGFMGVVLLGFWWAYGSSSPRECTKIKKVEKLLLELENKGRIERGHNLPFSRILLSIQVWIYVITYSCLLMIWTFGTVAMKYYMFDIFPSDWIEANAILIAVGIVKIAIVVCVAYLCDWLMIRYNVNKIAIRKTTTNIGGMAPPIFILAGSYSFCNRTLTRVCFIIAACLKSLVFAGIRLTPLDLAPNYAGFVEGLGRGFSGLVTILMINIFKSIVPNGTIPEYRFLFLLLFITCSVGTFFYVVFSTCEIQQFDKQKPSNKTNVENA